MNPSLALGGGDALDPVDTTFPFEKPVGSTWEHVSIFGAGFARENIGSFVEHFVFDPHEIGKAGIHAVEIVDPNFCFIATGSRAKFDNCRAAIFCIIYRTVEFRQTGECGFFFGVEVTLLHLG